MPKAAALQAALNAVIDFLSSAGPIEAHWAAKLRSILARIRDPATRAQGLQELESCFGGMGSLNDLAFCGEKQVIPGGLAAREANARLNVLLDRLFRELRLYGASWTVRVFWHWLEWRHRSDLPPRIKKSFR